MDQTHEYIAGADGTTVVSPTNAAMGFRNAAIGVRKHNAADASSLLNRLALQLTAHAVQLGYLTEEQIGVEVATAKQEAQANLDADLAGEAAEAPYEPLARMFDRLADLVQGRVTDTVPQTTAQINTQPITRVKVAARLREIAATLMPLLESPFDGKPLAREAAKLAAGAVAAGWLSHDSVASGLNALGTSTVDPSRNRRFIPFIEDLASEIENVDQQNTAQGDGATAPFTDISTEASKRAAIANELRTVRDQLKSLTVNGTPWQRAQVIDAEVLLEDKAIELGFVTEEEVNRLFEEGRSMDASNDSFASVVGVLANRIEQGAATQEKVA